METTQEKLEHIENLLTVLIDGFKRIEDRKLEIPEQIDCTPALGKMDATIEQLYKQVIKFNNLISAIGSQKGTVKDLVESLPKRIKTEVEHRFSNRTRLYLIVFVLAIFVAALSVFGCISLLISNSELKENDIKFRMVRLRKPSWANQVDTDYFKNSDSLERLVKFEEVKIIAVEKARQENRKR